MHFDAVLFVRFSARTSLEFRCFLVPAAAAAAVSGAAAASVAACSSLGAAALLAAGCILPPCARCHCLHVPCFVGLELGVWACARRDWDGRGRAACVVLRASLH
jgi:hypothetical protein